MRIYIHFTTENNIILLKKQV